MQKPEEFCSQIDLRLRNTMRRLTTAVSAAAVITAVLIYKFVPGDDFMYKNLHHTATDRGSCSCDDYEVLLVNSSITDSSVRVLISVSNYTDDEIDLSTKNIRLYLADTSTGMAPEAFPVITDNVTVQPHSTSKVHVLSVPGRDIPYDSFKAAITVQPHLDSEHIRIMLNK